MTRTRRSRKPFFDDIVKIKDCERNRVDVHAASSFAYCSCREQFHGRQMIVVLNNSQFHSALNTAELQWSPTARLFGASTYLQGFPEFFHVYWRTRKNWCSAAENVACAACAKSDYNLSCMNLWYFWSFLLILNVDVVIQVVWQCCIEMSALSSDKCHDDDFAISLLEAEGWCLASPLPLCCDCFHCRLCCRLQVMMSPYPLGKSQSPYFAYACRGLLEEKAAYRLHIHGSYWQQK